MASEDHHRTTHDSTVENSAAEWDARYSSTDRLWTSEVNPALVVEVGDLTPGRALDVGSGEGADARWLADQGWQVTAIDISQVAIDRAARIDPRENISWVRVDLTADEVPGSDFDLVALHYFPIRNSDEALAGTRQGGRTRRDAARRAAREGRGSRARPQS